jgi:hypothetical protein
MTDVNVQACDKQQHLLRFFFSLGIPPQALCSYVCESYGCYYSHISAVFLFFGRGGISLGNQYRIEELCVFKSRYGYFEE